MRANPHPTNGYKIRRGDTCWFQSSSASEPAPDFLESDHWHIAKRFQSSSASEPAPDANAIEISSHRTDVSILECERTRTRLLEYTIKVCSNVFQSSSASEPAPDWVFVAKDDAREVSILECERTRTRPLSGKTTKLYCSVSILECERTRTRLRCWSGCGFMVAFQSSSASEPAPDLDGARAGLHFM